MQAGAPAALRAAAARARGGGEDKVVHGHGHAEIDRLRAELEELTGQPVVLNTVDPPGPRERPGDAGSRPTAG